MLDSVLVRDVVAALCFAAFVGGARWSSGRASMPEVVRRRRVSVFTAFTLLVTCGSAVTARDLFPFTPWDLMCCILPDSVSMPAFVAVGDDDAEYAVDYRAWGPLSVDEISSWAFATFDRLDRAQQDEAAAWMLRRANDAAVQARSGRRIGGASRRLGSLTAPLFILHPAPWSRPVAVPAAAFTGIRLVRESWSIEQRRRDPSQVRRVVLYEYRPAR